MEIKRDLYLNQLVNARQNGFIKVVTGIHQITLKNYHIYYFMVMVFGGFRNNTYFCINKK